MQRKSKGFTLLELVIVLAIFATTLGIVASIFISMIKNQKGILSQQQLENQTSYLIEYISRAVRDAKIDSTGSCLSQSNRNYLLTRHHAPSGFYQGIKFITKENVCQEFFLDTDGAIKEIKNGGVAQSIVSNTFTITHFRFILNGDKTIQVSSMGDLVQPRITFSLKARTSALEPEKIIQTTVSRMDINI